MTLVDEVSGMKLVAESKALVEQRLNELFRNDDPANLYEPIRYALSSGGKRIRPVLVLLGHGMCGGNRVDALDGAAAVEIFHNFTLVHDDIMDESDTRRGLPTVHKRWSDGNAILAGDLMLATSHRLLAKAYPEKLASMSEKFYAMVVALCEGQTRDTDFQTAVDLSIPEYLSMIDGKTGALLKFALELGGTIAGGTVSDVDKLGSIGINMGRAFQIQDDLLDLFSEDKMWGKEMGGDLKVGKRTFLILKASELSRSRADKDIIDEYLNGSGINSDGIVKMKGFLEDLGVPVAAANSVSDYCDTATTMASTFPPSGEKQALLELIESLRVRLY